MKGKEQKQRKKKKPLHIAMFGQKSIPSRQGGVEIVVEELAVRMAEQDCKVTVYNRNGHHVSGKAFDEKCRHNWRGVHLRYVPTVDKKGLAAMSASFFAAIAAAFGKYDIVHVHAEGPCAMLWLPKLAGKRCIATIHGLDHQRAKWGKLASAYIMLGEKCAVKYADEIIVLSREMQKYFWDTYKRKTCYIPNGVRKAELQKPDIIQEKYGLSKDEYFLFLGRLVPEKGIRYLIEAFRQVKTDRKLVIAGGSSDTAAFESELHKMAEGDARILFTGFVQGKELQELYSNAYVYVLPSDLEGMPLGLLEAMSYGNCCLVSDIAECAFVAEGCVMLFQKSNVDDLREKIQLLDKDAKQVEHYRTGIADFVCETYNWDHVVRETLKLYQNTTMIQ